MNSDHFPEASDSIDLDDLTEEYCPTFTYYLATPGGYVLAKSNGGSYDAEAHYNDDGERVVFSP